MRYCDAKKKAVLSLKESGIEEAEVDAEYLLQKAAGLERSRLFMVLFDEIPESELDEFNKLIERRKNREPLQYIIGSQNFFGFMFLVSKDVLIPRFDTEILAEHALKRGMELDRSKRIRLLDLCTGSGCVAISVGLSLVRERIRSDGKMADGILSGNTEVPSELEMTGADISDAAVELAKKNLKLNADSCGFIYKGGFIKSDLFESVDGTFDIITANPPYIVRSEIDGLMPEISGHEPRLALDGGNDGMDFYRRICAEAPGYLNEGGRLLMEFDDSQADPVKKMMEDAGFSDICVHRDLAGLRRIIEGKV